MKVASFFAGAGGLDLGFKQAGFNVIWANEYDKNIWDTFQSNFPETKLDRRGILEVKAEEIPDVDLFIGGPPCQSFSEAGAKRGVEDPRGKLFFEYMRLLEIKKPKVFLAENVSGILAKRNEAGLKKILDGFAELGYNVSYGLVRASDYGVPQDRDRVFFVGYRTYLGKVFTLPEKSKVKVTLKDAIWDLRGNAVASLGVDSNLKAKVANHEYSTQGWSPMFLSRNRVRSWDEQSYTILASGRQCPLHPQAPKMVLQEKDHRIFVPGKEHLYRRLSVRECARIQTFPDDFIFKYHKISESYKMIGNAVPVLLAKIIAEQIKRDLNKVKPLEKYSAIGLINRY